MRKDIRKDVIAGITGFFAVSYIIIVNPMILADGGIPADLSVFATIFSSVIGCLIMWLWADAPIILTPGMGINAFFTYTIVISMGILEGILPDKSKFNRSFSGSAITAILSSFLGTSPTVVAAESATSIESGGRHGIMALTVAVLFAASLFFVPLLAYVPQAAVAPVIIITGAIMMTNLAHMDFSDFTEWFPAFLIVVLIPLTGSISTGLAFGFTAWPIMKLVSGRRVEVSGITLSLGILFLLDLICQAQF